MIVANANKVFMLTFNAIKEDKFCTAIKDALKLNIYLRILPKIKAFFCL